MIIGTNGQKFNKEHHLLHRVDGSRGEGTREGLSLQQIGIPDIPYIEKYHLRPQLGENWIEGQIIFIDNFENVVVNITREEFEEQRKGRSFRIVFKRDEVIDRISE